MTIFRYYRFYSILFYSITQIYIYIYSYICAKFHDIHGLRCEPFFGWAHCWPWASARRCCAVTKFGWARKRSIVSSCTSHTSSVESAASFHAKEYSTPFRLKASKLCLQDSKQAIQFCLILITQYLLRLLLVVVAATALLEFQPSINVVPFCARRWQLLQPAGAAILMHLKWHGKWDASLQQTWLSGHLHYMPPLNFDPVLDSRNLETTGKNGNICMDMHGNGIFLAEVGCNFAMWHCRPQSPTALAMLLPPRDQSPNMRYPLEAKCLKRMHMGKD